MPPYAASLDAMREVEDEIERRGLLRRYREILTRMWLDGAGPDWDNHEFLLRATALQRLQAAARVIQEVGNAG